MDSSTSSSPLSYCDYDQSLTASSEKENRYTSTFINDPEHHTTKKDQSTQESGSTSTTNIYSMDKVLGYNQCRQTSCNPYNKRSSHQNIDIFDYSTLQQPTTRSFEDTLQHNQAIKDQELYVPFMKRTSHSINKNVDEAFTDHQKAFKRKNRAVDWILAQSVPDMDQITEELSTKLQNTKATDDDESTNLINKVLPNEGWGDEFKPKKQPRHIRLFFQNIQGLQTSKRNNQDKWRQLLEYTSNNHIDLMGVAETCTNTTRHRIRHTLQRTAQQVFIQANLSWSTNDFQTDTNYRPGGTLLVTTDSWVGRIVHPLDDQHQMGRWSGNVYKLGLSRNLYVISAYRVCKQTSDLGLISSYRQQILKLQQRMPHNSNHCPRKVFIQDFITYMKDLRISIDDYVIVMMDANEQIGEDVHGISMMMEKLGLVDTFTRFHQRNCDLATHQSSKCKRIDFIFSSANILPHISACGYTPFYESVDTDHRGLFVELKPSIIDGQARISKPPCRLIGRTTSKAEVAAYKEYLFNKFHETSIFHRAEEFYQKAKSGTFTNEDSRGLNRLDREVTTFMLKAESETCSSKPQFPWSPSMHQASLLVKYWNLQYRNRKRDLDISHQLQTLYDQLSETQQKAINLNTNSTRYNLHKAKIDKQLLQMKAITHRRQARIQRIEHEADFRDTSVSHEKQRLAMIDETHHLFGYLKKLYGKKRSIGVCSIDIPFRDRDGNLTTDPEQATSWIKVHDPDEITQRLITRNIEHFGQAQGSDFTVSPIIDVFGYTGTGDQAEDMITGKHTPQNFDYNLSDGAAHIMAKLADGNKLRDICDDIQYDSFWKAFQVWDEQTSTSPSGRHLGHYKALIMADGQDKLYKKDEEGYSEKENRSPHIQGVYFHIALAATLSGTTLQRWCNSSTMIIEKIPGQPKINKLRVIHIFEADFNLMLKLLWSRRLVWNAHKHNRLCDAQAGSRPDRRCIDVVLRKTMKYTYADLTRTPLITIDNDAKACYDRIPCNLAMLVSRYYGMTKEACTFLSTTLQKMKYRIRTAAGDSEAWYQHSNDTPIHGTGQGSCASPSIWLLISSILMEQHENLARGMMQHDITRTSPIRVSAIEGFVDDTSIFINFQHSGPQFEILLEIINQLIADAKVDLEIWKMLLEASGGKLEWKKCFWYLLAWYFNRFGGDPIPLSLEQLNSILHEKLTVQDNDTGQQITLELKDVEEAHRTLGAYKSVTGNEEKQYEILLEKSNNLAFITKTGQLSRFQARRAFTSIYIPSMTYSLVSTNMSQIELKTIQSKAIQAFLPAMGYERTFPHAVAFASRQVGGLNLGDLYTECGISKTGAVIEHIRANTGLGRIMLINLNWLQLHAGLSTPVLESDINPIPYIPNNWFLHLKEFLHKANSTIQISDQWRPQLERERDCVIMDHIARLQLPKRVLRICNNWRIYFKVLCLSDITTPDGKTIQDRYWKASEAIKLISQQSRNTKLFWPIQKCPDKSTFSCWKQCLNLAFNLRNRQQLPISLGDWTVEPTKSNNEWEYYLQPYTNKLYKNCYDGTYQEHRMDQQQSSRFSATLKFEPVPEEVVTDLPILTFPVNPTYEYNTLRVKQSQCTCAWAYPSHKVISHSFDDHIETLPLWKQQILMHWESVQNHQLVNFFHTTTEILVATDGGFDHEQGTGSFGAVIADKETTVANISGSAPGRPDLHCSFRSELYGLLAACSLLNEIITFYQFSGHSLKTNIKFYLDSKSTIDRISNHRNNPIPILAMMSADMDLELQIHQELRILEQKGFTISDFKHVKAHQDRKKQYCELSREAQLNVDADRLASAFSKSNFVRQVYYPPSEVKATLYSQSTAITSKYKECLRHELHLPKLKEYVQKKWDWSDSTFADIWWRPHGTALKRLSHADGQKIQKFNYNHLPTNRRLSKFHQHINNSCSCNPLQEESDDHVIWCNSGDRLTAKQVWESDVYHYLSEEHTPSMVRTAIMIGFHHWIYNKPIPSLRQCLPTASDELIRTYNAQTIIGWNHFVRGRISDKWRHLIVQHLAHLPPVQEVESKKKTKKKKKDAVRNSNEWASRLIISMWHGVLILWDLRNRELHGPRLSGQSSAEKFRLMQEARFLLDISQQFQEQYEIDWFKKPIEELEKYSVISLKAWVRNARMMVKLHRLEIRKTTIDLNTDEDGLVDANSVDLLGEMEEMDISGS